VYIRLTQISQNAKVWKLVRSLPI